VIRSPALRGRTGSPAQLPHVRGTTDSLETLAARSIRAVLAFLRTRPYENAYLQSLLEHDPATAIAEGSFFLHRDQAGEIDGAINVSKNTVLAGSGKAAASAFAARVRALPAVRMIVGPRSLIVPFWEALAPHYVQPRLVRERQRLLRTDRHMLRGVRADASVRPATAEDLDTVTEHAALMIAGELGYDPRAARSSFALSIARMVDRGWLWVLMNGAELQFMCNVGITSRHTAQMQGVWTPQALRGRGIARRAFGAICDHLLDEFPTLSLYVNDFNAPAMAVYRRLGFVETGELSTLLFP